MLKKDLATIYNHAALIANQENCLQKKKHTVDEWKRRDNSRHNTIKQIKISQQICIQNIIVVYSLLAL